MRCELWLVFSEICIWTFIRFSRIVWPYINRFVFFLGIEYTHPELAANYVSIKQHMESYGFYIRDGHGVMVNRIMNMKDLRETNAFYWPSKFRCVQSSHLSVLNFIRISGTTFALSFTFWSNLEQGICTYRERM